MQQQVLKQKIATGCPKCKGDLLLRNRTSDGHPFYGCSSYPNCKYTRVATIEDRTVAYTGQIIEKVNQWRNQKGFSKKEVEQTLRTYGFNVDELHLLDDIECKDLESILETI